MQDFAAAQNRLAAALERLEKAAAGRMASLRASTEAEPAGKPSLEIAYATIERDCELLRRECAELRLELARVNERYETLHQASRHTGDRLDGLIGELDETLGE
jgi:hypothetical protein